MSQGILYRKEALEARHSLHAPYGEVIFASPLPAWFIVIAAVFCASLVIALMIWGSYTRRVTVAGEIVPYGGIVKIVAPQSGVIFEKRFVDGQSISSGQIIYSIMSERHTHQGKVQASISENLASKKRNLQSALQTTQEIQNQENNELEKKIKGLRSDIQNFSVQIQLTKERINMAVESVDRYERLVSQGLISNDQLQQKKEILLDLRLRLKTLEKDSALVKRDLETQQGELLSLPLKHKNVQAELERGLESISQEITENEAKRQISIIAPVSGKISSISGESGQIVTADRTLAAIVPKGAFMQAYLYVPSRAVGFIQNGAVVWLRYQAFPYQKFGQGKGHIIAVSGTALSLEEATSGKGITPEILGSLEGKEEPLYRITVQLDEQTMKTYGKFTDLKPGMLLQADIMLEKRFLYEWVIEPLYSISKKI